MILNHSVLWENVPNYVYSLVVVAAQCQAFWSSCDPSVSSCHVARVVSIYFRQEGSDESWRTRVFRHTQCPRHDMSLWAGCGSGKGRSSALTLIATVKQKHRKTHSNSSLSSNDKQSHLEVKEEQSFPESLVKGEKEISVRSRGTETYRCSTHSG